MSSFQALSLFFVNILALSRPFFLVRALKVKGKKSILEIIQTTLLLLLKDLSFRKAAWFTITALKINSNTKSFKV